MVLNWFSILKLMDLDAVCEAMEESSKKREFTLESEDPARFSSCGCSRVLARFFGSSRDWRLKMKCWRLGENGEI